MDGGAGAAAGEAAVEDGGAAGGDERQRTVAAVLQAACDLCSLVTLSALLPPDAANLVRFHHRVYGGEWNKGRALCNAVLRRRRVSSSTQEARGIARLQTRHAPSSGCRLARPGRRSESTRPPKQPCRGAARQRRGCRPRRSRRAAARRTTRTAPRCSSRCCWSAPAWRCTWGSRWVPDLPVLRGWVVGWCCTHGTGRGCCANVLAGWHRLSPCLLASPVRHSTPPTPRCLPASWWGALRRLPPTSACQRQRAWPASWRSCACCASRASASRRWAGGRRWEHAGGSSAGWMPSTGRPAVRSSPCLPQQRRTPDIAPSFPLLAGGSALCGGPAAHRRLPGAVPAGPRWD